MSYGFKVVVGRQDLADLGWPGYVGHPFILDGAPCYADLPNRYLLDRALGFWDPVSRGTKHAVKPAAKTLLAYAQWLANALEWAQARGVDLMLADYTTQLLAGYQSEMLTGSWSAKQQELSAATANLRVQAVLEYQMWGVDKGLRPPFEIPTVTRTRRAGSAFNSRSHQTFEVQARKGKAKVAKTRLVMPPDDWIAQWRQRVESRPVLGEVEVLIADLIMHTAIRLSEAVGWRKDTLPLDPRDWQVVNPHAPEDQQLVQVELKYGTKGPDLYVDHGDKVGKPETIKVPMKIAKRLHEYRELPRARALVVAMRGKGPAAAAAIRQNAVHLFLHPETGQRYNAPQVQYFWKAAKVSQQGQDWKWSPHGGRHLWACKTLERSMKARAELLQSVLQTPGLAAHHPLIAELKDTAAAVIQMEIQPQLRHSSPQTTELYLQWLFDKWGVALDLSKDWLAAGGVDDEQG
jgi:integrase